jgi:hypothetical protein
MTASIQPESKTPSRRALLAGALGGLGALAASAIGRASPVRAAPGDPVLVDGTHSGTGTTQITSTGSPAFGATSLTAGADAILGSANAVTGGGIGVTGETSSVAGTGVYGLAAAVSGTTYGVVGQNNSSSGLGVAGSANAVSGANVGVQGRSLSTSGTGVLGNAQAVSGTTYGVQGRSASAAGVGLYGTNSAGGLALRAAGRAKFNTSGVATISAGSTSKTITPGVNVTTSSFVLLTPKTNIGSRALWFTTDASGNKFTIHMSSSRSSGTKVAWLLLG